MTKLCPACGILVEPLWQFCQSCGAPAPSPTYRIAMPGERVAVAARRPAAQARELHGGAYASVVLVVAILLLAVALLA